jgi:hypothetical protein
MKWGAIKGLFFEDDGSVPEKKSGNTQKATAPATAPVPEVAPVRTIPVDVASGKPDQALIDTLAQALEKANLEGFDYFEFAKVLDNLAATLPSEQMRYQTAFASSAVMGANKQKLLDTAEHYLSVLAGEAEQFSKMVSEQTKINVTDKEDSILVLDANIKEKADLITKLTQEINEQTATKTAILNEAAQNRINIEKVQNDFAACLKLFIDKINADKAKINQYIAG